MAKPYTRKLETPIGTFYLEFNVDLTDSTIYCGLCDSNKKWITNIYHKETIEELKKIKSIGDLTDIGIAQNCTWAQSIAELTEEINDTYFWDEELEEERFSEEDMENYDFVNKVGTTYFIIDFE